MVFVSLTFLFLFLPCTLVLYYAFKKNRKIQNILLLLSSLFFYAWGEPTYIIILIVSIIINWIIALIIGQNRHRHAVAKCFLVLSVIINIGILFIFKYLDFTILQLNNLFHLSLPLRNIVLPIGISFYTFQALSYVIDVYRGEEYQKNPLYVGLYISLFPQLIAGPIIRYNSVALQIECRKESFEGFKIGTIRFLQGFSKKVLLANTMAVITDKAFSLGDELSVSFAWLGAIAYTLQIYFDFSGYSDMAIGLGRMFGFEFEENFNYPYTAVSVTDFWRRWHISLSTWFKDYVYIPLGGNRTGSQIHNYFNLFVVWLLTGIWHGANCTFIVWGLLYFVFLVIEKTTVLSKILPQRRFVGCLYTMLVVTILWVIFRSDSISSASTYIKTMFGMTNSNLYSAQTWIYVKENLVYLMAAVFLSVGIIPKMSKSTNKIIGPKYIYIRRIYEITIVLLFIVSIVYVINETYNPFIYFNF